VGSLEIVQIGLMDPNCLLELLDVFCSTFSECGLCLPVPLLSFFRCSIDLNCISKKILSGWASRSFWSSGACDKERDGTAPGKVNEEIEIRPKQCFKRNRLRVRPKKMLIMID
jgi:hypothetical protein